MTKPLRTPLHPIVDALRPRREQLDVTQAAVARAMGVQQSGISDYERGESSPTLNSLELWAWSLGFSIQITQTEEFPPALAYQIDAKMAARS